MTSRPIFGDKPGTIDTPDWVRDAIFYQIFPDRFAKSDRVVKPGGLEPWDSDPTDNGYKGGDLLGVVERLDYLVELGITAIYLCPIFQSASNHRYHTHDYFQVDPILGGNDAFAEMIDACHARGIRVVLDGVFNHCSRGFFQFNDILENGEHSPWLDWFNIRKLPVNAYDYREEPYYDAFYHLHALPKFNTDNPQVREFLMQVGEFWMKLGIDGWRLDAPDEITSPGFWGEFRTRMKAINPDAWICGEIWRDAGSWLTGDGFDSVMNYTFAEITLAFAGRDRIAREMAEGRGYSPWPGINAPAWADAIEKLLARDDWNVTTNLLNLIDSHDTARAFSLLGENARNLELAALIMFVYPGAPMILYGDEIGLNGGLPDRWSRKAFPWDGLTWDLDVHLKYRQLIQLRKRFTSLRTGTWQNVDVAESSVAILRRHVDDDILIVINTGEVTEAVRIDGVRPVLKQLAIGDDVTVRTTGIGVEVTVPSRSAAVFTVRDA
jgi:glycosidase